MGLRYGCILKYYLEIYCSMMTSGIVRFFFTKNLPREPGDDFWPGLPVADGSCLTGPTAWRSPRPVRAKDFKPARPGASPFRPTSAGRLRPRNANVSA